MAFEHYIRSGNRMLRCGYTTGTCAALAAQGAVRLLCQREAPRRVSILTPKGWTVDVQPLFCEEEMKDGRRTARCGIRKDAGDDPDATDGMTVICEASFADDVREEAVPQGSGDDALSPLPEDLENHKDPPRIRLFAGPGVGTVTKPGLDQPPGEPAVNSVPRSMIRQAAEAEMEDAEVCRNLDLTLSIPGGEETAKKTFNPMLGIEGGLSILGTSGIVEPMSEQALVATIETEMRQKTLKSSDLILTPGNYGMDYLEEEGISGGKVPFVKISNYLGDALDMAATFSVQRVLLAGHIGKLVKVAGGIMNTHSRFADCRTEILTALAAAEGADTSACREILEAKTTDEALRIMTECGLRDRVCRDLAVRIQAVLDRRAAGAYQIGAVVFSKVYGTLCITETAREILAAWTNEGKIPGSDALQKDLLAAATPEESREGEQK